MDIYSKKKRSQVMSLIKASNSEPEILVRKLLHGLGYRFRLHAKDMPGKPDIIFPKFKAVIFVHGCFWHHHEDCKKSKLPQTNVGFWQKKIMANVARDRESIHALTDIGWRVMVIWECEVTKSFLRQRLDDFLRGTNGSLST